MKVYIRYENFCEEYGFHLKKNSNSARRGWKEKMDVGYGWTYAG